jgi:site-specific recombinase XerD
MIRRFNSFLTTQLQAYLEFRRSLGYISTRSYALQFDHYLTFREIVSVEGISEALVSDWINAAGRAPATKNGLLSFARSLLRYLMRVGLARENPAERIPVFQGEPRRKPYLYSLHEIHRILEESGKLKTRFPNRLLGWSLETMILLIYACGLRLGEALKLRIKDVDFEEKTLALWNTKFHKERIVPFSVEIGEKLGSYLTLRKERRACDGGEAPFFWWDLSRCPMKLVETHFRRILVRCRLSKPTGPGPRLHDLRHAFATHRLYKWYQDGQDPLNRLPWLTTYMGHVNIEKTQVYLTVTQTLLREGDRRFQNAFEELAEKALGRARRAKP